MSRDGEGALPGGVPLPRSGDLPEAGARPTVRTDDPRVAPLLTASRASLRDRLRAGFHVEHGRPADSAWLGVSLGLPGWVDRLAWKTFVKAFTRVDAGSPSDHRDAEVLVRGWNVRVEQGGLDGPVRPLRARPRARGGVGEPIRFGHFAVRPLVPRGVTADLGAGVELDYGAGANPRLDPTRLLRDPLAAVDPDGNVLLGWSWLALGPGIPTPSWFVLRRLGSLDEVGWAAPSPVVPIAGGRLGGPR